MNRLSVSDSIRRPKFGSNSQFCDRRNLREARSRTVPDGSKQANGLLEPHPTRMTALSQKDVSSQKTGTFRSRHNWLCPTCRSEVWANKDECFQCGCRRPGLGAPKVISALQRGGNQWGNPQVQHNRYG